MLEVKYNGQVLSQEELNEIADNFVLTRHARQRISERLPGLDIRGLIKSPLLAYYNTDGSVNVALNAFEYIVIGTDSAPYPVITFKERSHNSINIFQKQRLATKGVSRSP